MISYKCGAADEDLETCFPSSRIDFSRLNLFSPVWILYFPFGCILFLARLICIVVASLCAKHFHKDEYVNVFASNNYSWINGLRSEVRFLATTDGSATSWKDLYNCHSDAAAADTNTKSLIFALEHHCMQVEQAFFHHAPQPLYFIASERTASGLTGILTGATKFCLFKGNRQPLREVVEIWRSKPKFGGLCIFPQASTGSNNSVHSFMPRTFEVLTDQEDVHPVVVDYTPMMPINLRTACSGFLADLFWLEVMPVTYVRFTVLPAVPKGLTPEQAAAHCQAEIARHAEVPRQELDVNCFDKRHWRKTVEARLHPRYRAVETQIMKVLQSMPLLMPIALGLHYVIQESVLIGIAAVLIFGGFKEQDLLYLGRSICGLLLLCTIFKLIMQKPRPAWVKDTEMHNPYKLKFPIHQYDYTFPSGHSAFVACLWLSYFFMSQQPGRAFHFHWWLHLVLAVLTVSTGYSRIYLSLHWPRDVACGWALGAFWSWVWCKKLDLHFLAGAAWVQFLTVTLVTLAIGGVILLLTTRIGEHNDAKIIAWSKVVDHPLQTHDPKTWLLQLAMFWVVLTTVPQVLWIYPHVPLPYCPAPGWLRACFIFIGFTVLVVMWVVMLWFLPRQLKLTGFRRLNSILVPLAVAPTMRSRSQTLDVMLTAGSTATDAQFESAALEAGAQLQQAAKDEREFAFSTGNAYKSGIMYFVSVLLMLEWILICSQVLYSKVEQRVCNAA